MTVQWAQALLQFMLWFALASIGGCVSYALFRNAPQGVSNSAGIFAIFLACVSGLIQPMGILELIALISLPSSVAALFEKAIDGEGRTWKFHFGLCLVTYLLSILSTILIGGGLTVLSDSWNSALMNALGDGVSAAGIYAALLLTPASIPFFRWIVHNSKLRPGIDRHLEEGEVE